MPRQDLAKAGPVVRQRLAEREVLPHVSHLIPSSSSVGCTGIGVAHEGATVEEEMKVKTTVKVGTGGIGPSPVPNPPVGPGPLPGPIG